MISSIFSNTCSLASQFVLMRTTLTGGSPDCRTVVPEDATTLVDVYCNYNINNITFGVTRSVRFELIYKPTNTVISSLVQCFDNTSQPAP